MIFISKQELVHRLCNGFISSDGYMFNDKGDAVFTDLWVQNGIDILSEEGQKIMSVIAQIVESLPEYDESMVTIRFPHVNTEAEELYSKAIEAMRNYAEEKQ